MIKLPWRQNRCDNPTVQFSLRFQFIEHFLFRFFFVVRKPFRGFPLYLGNRMRMGHNESDQHWYRVKGNTGHTSGRRGGAHMGSPEHVDTISSWTDKKEGASRSELTPKPHIRRVSNMCTEKTNDRLKDSSAASGGVYVPITVMGTCLVMALTSLAAVTDKV